MTILVMNNQNHALTNTKRKNITSKNYGPGRSSPFDVASIFRRHFLNGVPRVLGKEVRVVNTPDVTMERKEALDVVDKPAAVVDEKQRCSAWARGTLAQDGNDV